MSVIEKQVTDRYFCQSVPEIGKQLFGRKRELSFSLKGMIGMAKFSLVVLRKDKNEDFIVFEDEINAQYCMFRGLLDEYDVVGTALMFPWRIDS